MAGAPGPYEFVALAAIIGIVAEVQFKGAVKSALNNLIDNMRDFSADQIVKGAEALKEAAAAT